MTCWADYGCDICGCCRRENGLTLPVLVVYCSLRGGEGMGLWKGMDVALTSG